MSGPNSILGRSIVLYEREDDHNQDEHPPAEEREARFREGSGRRIACCVVALAKGETPEPKAVEAKYEAPTVAYEAPVKAEPVKYEEHTPTYSNGYGDASYGDASYDAGYGDASYDAGYGDASYGDASYGKSSYGDNSYDNAGYGS